MTNQTSTPLSIYEYDMARELACGIADLIIGHLVDLTVEHIVTTGEERVIDTSDATAVRNAFEPLLQTYRTAIYRDGKLPAGQDAVDRVMDLVHPLGMPFFKHWKNEDPGVVGDLWWNGIVNWYSKHVAGVANPRLGEWQQIPEAFVMHMLPMMRTHGVIGPWPLPQMIATRSLFDLSGLSVQNYYTPNASTTLVLPKFGEEMHVHLESLEWMLHCARTCERHLRNE